MKKCSFCNGRSKYFYKRGSREFCYKCEAELRQREMDRYGKTHLFVVSRRKEGVDSPCLQKHNHYNNDYRHFVELSYGVLLPCTPFEEGNHNWWCAKRYDFYFWDFNCFEWHGVLITGGMNERATCYRLSGFRKENGYSADLGLKSKYRPIFEEEE